MTEPTKIDFRHRRAKKIGDVVDLVEILFPGNRNQQHAAARILLALKAAGGPVSTLQELQERHGVSRRTLDRTRAKLARLGLIERVTWMNSRYGGQEGWKLSSRMSTGLRSLADRIEHWRRETSPGHRRKEELIAGLLAR
ncbi:MAG: Rrf2 family transcriptional regulator [Phycisphaerae bacterium]|nr:Rrf2 family transcriptional regulator [Phycisphaerae bacterium]